MEEILSRRTVFVYMGKIVKKFLLENRRGKMKYVKAWLFLSICLLLVSCSAQKSEVKTSKPAETDMEHTVVATTLAVAEIMDKLEVDLAGVPTTQYTLPERYKDVVEVGNPMSPDMEIIKSLKPTEVLSVTTLEYDLSEKFESMKIPASFVNLESVDNMIQSINDLGAKYDRAENAKTLVDSIESKVKEIKDETKDKEQPVVLILLGVPGASYLVATENSYVGNLVEVMGGKNAVEGQAAEYISANTEFLQQTNPDIILRLSHGVPDQVAKEFDKEFAENDIWKHFNAVKNGKVYDLEEPIFATTANLNITQAFDQLMEMMYE